MQDTSLILQNFAPMVRSVLVDVYASAAVPGALPDDKVCSRVWMAFRAMSLSSVSGRYRVTSEQIFSGSDRLKVFRVHANGVFTQMINLKSFRYFANVKFIGESVSVIARPRISPNHVHAVLNRSVFHVSSANSAAPVPTFSGLNYLIHEHWAVVVFNKLIHAKACLTALGAQCKTLS